MKSANYNWLQYY